MGDERKAWVPGITAPRINPSAPWPAPPEDPKGIHNVNPIPRPAPPADGKGYLEADPERTPTPHYMRGGLEFIDAARAISTPAEFQAYCRISAFKYLWRLGEKDTAAREAKKCLDYVRWLKDSLDKEQA